MGCQRYSRRLNSLGWQSRPSWRPLRAADCLMVCSPRSLWLHLLVSSLGVMLTYLMWRIWLAASTWDPGLSTEPAFPSEAKLSLLCFRAVFIWLRSKQFLLICGWNFSPQRILKRSSFIYWKMLQELRKRSWSLTVNKMNCVSFCFPLLFLSLFPWFCYFKFAGNYNNQTFDLDFSC